MKIREIEYYTIGQAASFLGVSRDTVKRLESRGLLKSKRHPHNRYRIYQLQELHRLMDSIEESFLQQERDRI